MYTFTLMTILVIVGVLAGTVMYCLSNYPRPKSKIIVLVIYGLSWVIDLIFESYQSIGFITQIILGIYFVLDIKYLRNL